MKAVSFDLFGVGSSHSYVFIFKNCNQRLELKSLKSQLKLSEAASYGLPEGPAEILDNIKITVNFFSLSITFTYSC